VHLPCIYAHIEREPCIFDRLLLAPTSRSHGAIEIPQSLALHLQFHLRILLEDLRVSLAKHLGYALVRYPSGAQPRGLGRVEVVKAMPHLRTPQRRLPCSLQRPLISLEL
jgi:hypothetical protein